MKQVILTGLAAALTVTVAGKLTSSEATTEVPQGSQASAQNSAQSLSQEPNVSPEENVVASGRSDISKIGERQSEDGASDNTVATIYAHLQEGRQAATLYVRNIPVVTFVGAETSAAASDGVKVATTDAESLGRLAAGQSTDVNNPVWRATTIAAKLNQVNQSGIQGDAIKVLWDKERQSYVIRAENEHLIEVANDSTQLPKSTSDVAEDALQITNRLRRQLGNAEPLADIEGRPQPEKVQTIAAVGPVRFQVQGWASWYGPGFHGNYTANGEVYNQYDLTAAHRTLPFGTRIRVTNLNNGRSVTVRVNDRGPFYYDREIDLSQGAAQVLGVISSGVAPVRLDVLN